MKLILASKAELTKLFTQNEKMLIFTSDDETETDVDNADNQC